MTAALFWGCVLVAYGIPFVLFTLMICRNAQLVIVLLASAFFWLSAFICSSILWSIFSPFKDAYFIFVPVNVAILEACRYFFYVAYQRAERQFAVVDTNRISFPMTDFYSAMTAGVAWGLTHTILYFGNIFSQIQTSGGKGVFYSAACPYFSTFVLTAWNAFLFNALHIFLMLIAFDAYRRRHRPKVLLLWGLHLVADCSLLFNMGTSDHNGRLGGCVLSLPLLFVVTFFAGGYMVYVVNAYNYRSVKSITRRRQNAADAAVVGPRGAGGGEVQHRLVAAPVAAAAVN